MGGILPHGTLSSNGQEQVTDSIFIPPITNFIRFKYRSITLLPGWTVQTKSLGNWKSNSGTANPITYRTLDVGLYASNVYITISFQTTDTNGGNCEWQAYHN